MAADRGPNPSSSGWPDLTFEVLECILILLSTLRDRISFGAVCKPWRSLLLQQQPPSTWTMLLSPNPNPNPRCPLLPLPHTPTPDTLFLPDIDGVLFVGSSDSWLLVVHPHLGTSLLNPFSQAHIPLPTKTMVRPDKNRLRKAVLSPGANPVIALLHSTRLCICRPQWRKWVFSPIVSIFDDIIFYQSMLHGVNQYGEVYVIEVGEEQVKSVKVLDAQPHAHGFYHVRCQRTVYLVEWRGSLLMVFRLMKFSYRSEKAGSVSTYTTMGFKVYTLLGLRPGYPPSWAELKSLEGHALFLGTSSSKSVPAAQCVGVEEDCIYFTEDPCCVGMDILGESFACLDSGVFSMKDDCVKHTFPPITEHKLNMHPPLWLQFTHA